MDTGKTELKDLKDQYENYMQLKGPLVYWKQKRKEHQKGQKDKGVCVVVFAILAVVSLGLGALTILPEFTANNDVPWRQLGLFALLSTFVLWLVKFYVKLYLSHVHLYADAREREVMISTFMALVKREESREGLSKTDIALVLAPIFRPSTTGVIKDDGGPTSVTDFITKLAGK